MKTATRATKVPAGGESQTPTIPSLVLSDLLSWSKVRAAEASGPPPTSLFGIHSSAARRRAPPPVCTQLSALLQRASINVARDPYLAGLHIVLTVFVGVVVGSLFRDLGRLNGCTAGVQVGGAFFFFFEICVQSLEYNPLEVSPQS